MKEFWAAERRIYPSLFRVLIGMVLLVDLVSIFPSSDILYNPEFNAFLPTTGFVPYLSEYSMLFFSISGLILIAFILGIGKNISSFLVFVFHFWMIQLTLPLMTWGETILKFSLLYFIFVDSFKYFSIQKSKGEFQLISKLAVWSIILHVFLIYLNNTYFKILDKDWQQGIAVFYSFSQYAGFQDSVWNGILSHEFMAKFINYLIIFQQLSFVPMVIWKKTRGFAILLSILIHIIMLFQFGLWKFELIVILLYGFLLNDEEIKKICPKRILKYLSPN
ncbi:hypothetical protein [Moheibacter lacus]|uniref:HTTM-like domain-containing protein n=1 Tax=Moheibacter lacus TaxID=2745851 RepID=A0A838ZL87_9FLAO|nr:hypothetical protein [Moheibacter lacus]MBA5628276.1 hypothetical protein [Moheibacter lacus]